MINHVVLYNLVMLIEIPDFDVIFTVLVMFLVGFFIFSIYYKIRPYVNLKKSVTEPSYLERLEYYEHQLIDMKIRLDAINMGGVVPETPEIKTEPRPATKTNNKR